MGALRALDAVGVTETMTYGGRGREEKPSERAGGAVR
jgi:hypothetical protein